MQFGIPTLIELESIESCAALCRELGLDFIELNMNLPEYRTRAIGDANIKICTENTRTFQLDVGRKSLAILLESPVFSVTFDIGHDGVNDFLQRPLINSHIHRLYHMHIHDAVLAEKRDHLTLGEGDLDLVKYLDLAKEHDCRAVIEVKTVDGLRQSVNWLKESDYL